MNTKKISTLLLVFTVLCKTIHAQDKTDNTFFNGANLYDDVTTYVKFGIHRTATDGDNKTSAWIKDKLDKDGFKTEYLYFPVKQFFPETTTLQVAGKIINVFPLWPVKDPSINVTAAIADAEEDKDLLGKIAIVKIATLDNTTDSKIKAAITAGAKAVVVIYANAAGEIAAINTQPTTSWDAPVVQIAPKDAAILQNATTAKLTVTGKLKDVQARNVIGTIGNGPKSVIISTPISGWFTCGGERGPGIAVFNALAAWIGSQKNLPYKFIFIANSGHELADHEGTHVYLEKKAPAPADVRLWVHLGASFATYTYQKNGDGVTKIPVVDPNRIVYFSDSVANVIDDAFQNIAIKKYKGKALGELAVAAKAGYTPFFGFVGSDGFTFFHTPADDTSTTSPALLEEIGKAVKKAIQLELFNTTNAIQ
jgi:glycine cleavage system H lipoate-binding protein